MRKLENKATKKKKKMKNQIIIGVIMISILVFSTAGFALLNYQSSGTQNSETRVTKNGITFQRENNFWTTTISNQRHIFFTLPIDINNIPINITSTLASYRNQPLYIVNENAARNQIDFNLLTPNYVLRTQTACLNQTKCNEDIPIKNCTTDNIIIYKDSNITTVYQEEKCIYIAGDPVKGTDKFLQKILQIN